MILCHCNNVRTGDTDEYHLIGTKCGRCKMNDNDDNVTFTIGDTMAGLDVNFSDGLTVVNVPEAEAGSTLEGLTFTVTATDPLPEDPVLQFLKRLLDPEGFGHAVSAEVRDEARVLLGMPRVETLTDQQLEDHGVA